MELKEAKSTIENFEKALFKLKCNAQSYHAQKEKVDKLTRDNNELKEKLQEVKKYEWLYKKLESASNVKICPECEGKGGFEYQIGEFEMDYDECKICGTTGIVKKQQHDIKRIL